MISEFKKTEIKRRFSVDGIYTAFPFRWDKGFVFNGESHDFWEIVFIKEGEVEVVEDDRIYTLGKNSMILHAPLEFHRIRSKGDKEPEGFILTFNAIGELPKELKQGVFFLTGSQSEEYLSVCRLAQNFITGEHSSDHMGQETADSLSAFLVRLSTVSIDRSLVDRQSATEYRRLVSDMTECVCQSLTLCDLAVRNSVSISYIKLLFKKYAGISPKAYFTGLRVRHAAQLLREKYTVAEVSELMDFSSPSYFSVFFKNHTGMLPSEYKYKSARNENCQLT